MRAVKNKRRKLNIFTQSRNNKPKFFISSFDSILRGDRIKSSINRSIWSEIGSIEIDQI